MSARRRIPAVVFAFALSVAGVSAAAAAAQTPPDRQPRPTAEELLTPPTRGERAARIALEAVGVPYRWGGESPTGGFDCSGLVRWAWGRLGVDLPHSSYALYGVGRPVGRAQLEPGDVLVFEGLGHVGLYVGRGRMVHAPQTGREVEVVRLASTGYGGRLVGARRVSA
jgi:cell wall-associated NlpC family hydrolase